MACKLLVFNKYGGDPIGDAYKRVRDTTVCNDFLPNGMAVAILELVKAEIIRNMQGELDAVDE